MTTGLVIGKFYPPHRGHHFLIDYALERVDRLTVIVCDRIADTIPGPLRAEWIRRIHPSAEVLLFGSDGHDPDDSALWARLTIDILGRAPDIVFTSEDYGERYCRFLGSRHVLVDRERVAVPISGTAIRADPLRHWEYLMPPVRSFFAKRVVIVGAESTGKTTLAQALARHYRTVWVPEFGRIYAEGRLPAAGAETWTSDEFEFIAKQQNLIEDRLAERSNGIVIADTDSFATGIWHERYLGTRSQAVANFALGRRVALTLLTAPDIPFVQDGTRDGEQIRDWMHARFVDELTALGRPFRLIGGGPQERLQTAVAAIDEVLQSAASPRGGCPDADSPATDLVDRLCLPRA